jgi:KUP system potassium uptake protein
MTTHQAKPESPRGRRLASLTLLAMGIVYGDIGTSPLYAIRECFHGLHRVAPSHANVLGVLSLIFWSLIIVVTLKYQVYVLGFHNRGEGGILALMGLARGIRAQRPGLRAILVVLGVFGASLLYGDGMITPAISVLSAIEGLEVATPFFKPYVLPVTIVILILLFLFQRRGTAGVGSVFGPVVLVWFATIAVLGVRGILWEPSVLSAMNPQHAIRFFTTNGVQAFLVLGAVFLVTTGGEALYADLGHFGERPIRIGWFFLVGPCLLLNYFGQGALLIRHPEAAHSPFYLLAPIWALYPLVALAAMATVIASQAIISGVFSLTRQAIQLGYLPRMEVVHTSGTAMGQIYLPAVNRAVMVATIALVLGFRTSTNLAAAYGVAVSTTMVITTILAYFVSRDLLGWSPLTAGAVTAALLVVDLAFFGANMFKVADGGWFPLVIAAIMFTLMTTWRRGRQVLYQRLREGSLTSKRFIESLQRHVPVRVPGTAVFLSHLSGHIPDSLLHSLKHYKVLHEQVLILTVVADEISRVDERERVSVEPLGEGLFRVVGRYGYMEHVDIPKLLEGITDEELKPINPMDTTYILGVHRLIVTRRQSGMAMWRERVFASMMKNATSASNFFGLPPNRVVELGTQTEI